MQMPALGFGTFRLQGDIAYQSVLTALECGYRHIDTAQIYDNEEAVGQAIIDSKIPREDIFLTTKVWNNNLGEENFIRSVHQSLDKLQTNYVDLLLIHWPAPPVGIFLADSLEYLQCAHLSGIARNIGVSNFTIKYLQLALNKLPKGTISTNQIEVHPYLQNQKVRDFCLRNGIHVTAFMPFAYGKVLNDPVIKRIADKHQCMPAEVAIAWLQQADMSTIPSSTKRLNMKINQRAMNVRLDEDDCKLISTLDRNDRQANPDFSPVWD